MDYVLRYLILPSLDLITGCLRRYRFLKRLQWNKREVERWLDQRVRKLVNHAYATVPYYRQVYDERGVEPGKIKTAGDLVKVPIITKSELKLHFPEGTCSTVIPRRLFKPCRTSGSTGQIFDFYDDGSWGAKGQVIASRFLFESWMGLKIGDIAVHPKSSNLLSARDRFMGGVTIPTDRLERDPLEAVELIRSFHPAALMGDVSVLSSFANMLIGMGQDARNLGLRAVATHAEMLLPRDREAIAQTFGCPVFDRYALTEVAGYVAQECEYHCGLHVNPGLAKVEVVRDGEVCGAGETGRLIVTNLHNYAMPFVRYDTGDLATVGEECQCGRAFSLLSSIEGRAANWVITESFPVAWTRYLTALQTMRVESVERFQFIQTHVGRLTLLIAPKSQQNDAKIEEIRARLNGIHPLVRVIVEAADVIDEGPGRKRVLFRPLGSGISFP